MNNVVSSRFKFFRNVKDYKFVKKLDKEKQIELIDLIEKKFLDKIKANRVDDRNFKKVEGEIEFYYEILNGEHLTLTCSTLDFDKNAYLKAKEQIDMLSNLIPMSYSDDYGFLTSDIMLVGSGCKIEADFDLVGIKKYGKINQVKQNIEKLGYSLTEKYNNIFTLSTTCNLGYTTDEIFEDFSKMAAKVQDLEIESEKLLYATNSDTIIDKALRAQAILNSAYILNFDELNNYASDLRIGANLDCIKIDINKINKLENLVLTNRKEIVSQSELKDMANSAKSILKGE